MIEAFVESRILAALRGLSFPCPVTVSGAYEPVPAGEVKDYEAAVDEVARIGVAAASPAFDAFDSPLCNVEVSIAVAVRRDADPTGAHTLAVLSAVSGLLLRWQLSADATSATFDGSEFSAGGVQLSSGTPPEFDADLSRWMVSRTLTVRGTVPQTT